ncbi:MAG: hypothetical protein ACYCOU_04660 [Sulfobacillus sp.]
MNKSQCAMGVLLLDDGDCVSYALSGNGLLSSRGETIHKVKVISWEVSLHEMDDLLTTSILILERFDIVDFVKTGNTGLFENLA